MYKLKKKIKKKNIFKHKSNKKYMLGTAYNKL